MTAADILALLDADPQLVVFVEGVTVPADDGPTVVYDGYPVVDEENKVIAVPMPYLVFNGSPGRDHAVRFSQQAGGRVYEFAITGVGETREQAQWALDRAYGRLNRKKLAGSLIRRDEAHLLPRKDDDYNRPGGEPIWYGVDPYSLAV